MEERGRREQQLYVAITHRVQLIVYESEEVTGGARGGRGWPQEGVLGGRFSA